MYFVRPIPFYRELHLVLVPLQCWEHENVSSGTIYIRLFRELKPNRKFLRIRTPHIYFRYPTTYHATSDRCLIFASVLGSQFEYLVYLQGLAQRSRCLKRIRHRSTATPLAMMDISDTKPIKARRTHQKSRLGCANCKKRRIKVIRLIIVAITYCYVLPHVSRSSPYFALLCVFPDF